MTPIDSAALPALRQIAEAAGRAIMAIYATDFAARTKDDASPVTDADEAAEAIILHHLASLTPDIPIVAEESAAKGHLPAAAQRFWLVDPLDGTREFVSRNGEFTVNLGLIDDGRPVAGIVLAPALGEGFAGIAGRGAWKWHGDGPLQPIAARPRPVEGCDVLASRSHRDAETDAFLATVAVRHLVAAGSSLKFCRLAEGAADLYPRFGPTSEWDTAAGHAVLLAAGGRLTQPDGAAFVYGKPGYRNGGFIATGAWDYSPR